MGYRQFNNISFVNVQSLYFEDGFCSSIFVLRGLPSDIHTALQQFQFTYFAYQGDPTSGSVHLILFKPFIGYAPNQTLTSIPSYNEPEFTPFTLRFYCQLELNYYNIYPLYVYALNPFRF